MCNYVHLFLFYKENVDRTAQPYLKAGEAQKSVKIYRHFNQIHATQGPDVQIGQRNV